MIRIKSNELIFDQGFGDILSAYGAENLVNDDILGSLELAFAETGAKLIGVPPGHKEYGAVRNACDGLCFENITLVHLKLSQEL